MFLSHKGVFMKKLLMSLVFFVFHSLHCFSLPWFSKPQAVMPKVLNIYAYDPIKFEDIEQELFEATKRQDVVGIIFVINSNGGNAGEFSVVHDMIKNFSTTRPVVALIAGGALSGGYLIASAANNIIAHSVSDIGNIGVIRFIDRYKNIRVSRDTIEADLSTDMFIVGEFKGIENPFAKELSDNQRAYLQASLLKSYDIFLTLVAQNRHFKKEDYKLWAEGKIFLPPEALELGLIDEIGTIFDAQEKIKQLIVERNPQATYVDSIEFVS
jgi:protease-4